MRWTRLCVFLLLSTCSLVPAQGSDPVAPGQMVDLGGRKLHLNCTGKGSPIVLIENGGGGFSIEWALVQLVRVENSGHMIPLYRPEIVVNCNSASYRGYRAP
jgi:hypothetical protein